MIALLKRLCASTAFAFTGGWQKFIGKKSAAGMWSVSFKNDKHRAAMQLADSVHQFFDKESERLGDVSVIRGQRRKIACKAGCSYCCSLYVSASSSELLLIEGFISRLPPNAGETVKARVKAAYVRAKEKSMAERDSVRIRCPLLSNGGTCDVYPVRPLTCRSYVSFDLPACKTDAENPGAGTEVGRSASLIQIRSMLFGQLVSKERERGYAAGSYELVQGLHALLMSEGAIESVCRGIDPMVNAISR
ncbi:YkgJ family cysteine cluster protein [Xanthomonas campestris pv. cannae]|nr:YkgJ family cysteine cluster protein [Xanthomonas campestris pv. cannae]